jgi:hypothetical protein
MVLPFESWQIEQLTKIGSQSPERLTELLDVLWARYPALVEELVIRAIADNQLTIQRGAEVLAISDQSVEEKLEHFMHSGDHRIDFDNGVAKLMSCNVAVWEVAREFQSQGSIEALVASFPGIPVSDLKAALRYASGHPVEISDAISRFELAYDKKPSLLV